MSFQPVLPLGGYAGWRFLGRTMDSQRAAFDRSPTEARLTDYVRANIAKATTPEALVKDRRLLEVTLKAYGLSDDIDAKAFIQKVLEGGTLKPEALANRLADKRYAALALEFGYGNLGARTALPGFADRLIARYQGQAFQEAVGEQDEGMRLALNLSSGLADVIKTNGSNRSRWFAVMGTPPLRTVVETALGFPSSFGRLDIDQQLSAFQERAEAVLGTSTVEGLAEPAVQEKIIRLFLVRQEAQASSMSSGQTALTLLSSLG